PEAAAHGRALRCPRRDHARPAQRGAAAGLGGDGHDHPLRHPFALRGGLPRRGGAAARRPSGPGAGARAGRPAEPAAHPDARNIRLHRARRPSAACAGDLLVSPQAVHALPIASAFTDDAEAQARFDSIQRYLKWRKRLLPLIAVACLLLLWDGAVRAFGIRSYIAPAPSAVATVLYAKFGLLMQNLVPTAIDALPGFLLGNAAAILNATAFVYKRTLEEAFFPVAVMINTVPVVAKAPILVLLLGNGMEPKIAIAALICFFPTL